MQALSIVIAFFAILTPGIIVWLGIKWIAQRREAARKAEQDREMREQDERMRRMASMRKPMSKQASPGLHAVPVAPQARRMNCE